MRSDKPYADPARERVIKICPATRGPFRTLHFYDSATYITNIWRTKPEKLKTFHLKRFKFRKFNSFLIDNDSQRCLLVVSTLRNLLTKNGVQYYYITGKTPVFNIQYGTYCVSGFSDLINLIQLLKATGEALKSTKLMITNETTGASNHQKWIFDIFHGEHVNGIRQTRQDISGNSKTTHVGYAEGSKTRIILYDEEEVTKVEFAGLD